MSERPERILGVDLSGPSNVRDTGASWLESVPGGSNSKAPFPLGPSTGVMTNPQGRSARVLLWGGVMSPSSEDCELEENI